MMEIGNGGLTAAEERAHFGLWAICKSPLILGMDLTKIPSSSLSIIKNKAIIAINQDSLGKAASTFTPKGQSAPSSSPLYPYWAGPLSDGVVIGLVAANGAATLTSNFADVPGLGSSTYSRTELYSGSTGSGTSASATLGSHDMVIFKVSTNGKSTATTTASGSTLTNYINCLYNDGGIRRVRWNGDRNRGRMGSVRWDWIYRFYSFNMEPIYFRCVTII